MDTFIQYLLYLHIIAGTIALVVAPLAMIVKKGKKQHKKLGLIYFWGMTFVVVSAIIISIYKWIPFLLMLSIFSYYAIGASYRILYLKKLHNGQKPRLIDWLMAVFTILFNLGLIMWGGYYLILGVNKTVFYLALIFGIGGLIIVYTSVKNFIFPPSDKMHWWYSHMGGMLGGYIATVTAFISNVMTFAPPIYKWLLPSLIGVPLLLIWINYYRKKFNPNKAQNKLQKIS